MKPRIVVCESDEGLRAAFQLMLEDWAEVQIIEQAEACVRELNQAPIDLLIIDVDDQTLDPLQLLGNIRAAYPNLKILLVAGSFDLDFQVAALKFSPVSFLTKSFEPKVAMEKMQTLVGHSASPIRTRIVRIALPHS